MAPVRVQLSRRAGWRMPEDTVKVDRTTKWGNPYDWRDWLDDAKSLGGYHGPLPYAEDRKRWAQEQAAEAFAADVRDGEIVLDLSALRGKNLACWCPRHQYCHADVLLGLANRPADPAPTAQREG